VPRFAANLSMLYGQHPFLARFAAAAGDGFSAVEYLFPYEHAASVLADCLRQYGLTQVLFNAPPGDYAAGDRGLACVPGRETAFRRDFQEFALPYAQALMCRRIHVMAGILQDGLALQNARDVYLENLAWAAREAASCGVDILIEPINTRDMPGYFLNRQDQAHAVVLEVGMANLKVQMDLYHCQIVEGDVASKIREFVPTGRVGHVQIAGVPERHEPDLGELNYPYLFKVLDQAGFDGWVGCEYRPRGDTSAGLGWFKPHAQRPVA